MIRRIRMIPGALVTEIFSISLFNSWYTKIGLSAPASSFDLAVDWGILLASVGKRR